MTGTEWKAPGEGTTLLNLWVAFLCRSDRTVEQRNHLENRWVERFAGQQVSAQARTNLALTGLPVCEYDWQRFESDSFKIQEAT